MRPYGGGGARHSRFLSSVRLAVAVILLTVLIVGIAVGTICESRFDAKIARAYVYEAPWFDAWMILLGGGQAAQAMGRTKGGLTNTSVKKDPAGARRVPPR